MFSKIRTLLILTLAIFVFAGISVAQKPKSTPKRNVPKKDKSPKVIPKKKKTKRPKKKKDNYVLIVELKRNEEEPAG